jgi:CelD/BcsL family acetyltransferase involved in cellulose biosynthesis
MKVREVSGSGASRPRSAGWQSPVPQARLIRGRAQLLRALQAAEDLFEHTRAPVCARALWVSTWLAAVPAVDPVAVVVEAGDRLTGLACLAVSRRGPLRTVTLAADGPSDYGWLPARDAASAAALADGVADLLGTVRRPWRLRLSQLPLHDPVAARLLAVLPGARTVPGQGCPQLTFGPERVLERHLSASGRRSARHARTRLAASGHSVRVERTSDPAAVRCLLPDLVAMHRARDHSRGRRSDLDDDTRRLFYIRVICRLADAGAIDVPTLWLDDRLAAFFVGIRDGDTYRSWDGRISSDWPHLPLGRVLRTELLAALLADPAVAGVDWMRGELQHKMHAVSHVLPTEHLLAESSPPVRAAGDCATAARRILRAATPDRVRHWIRGSRLA